jgi:hypothetical protein
MKAPQFIAEVIAEAQAAEANGQLLNETPMRHLTIVVCRRRLRDFFAKRYWVRCWKCNLRVGPFLDEKMAELESARLYGPLFSQDDWCDGLSIKVSSSQRLRRSPPPRVF